MQVIRNILKITPSGAVLSDEYGSTSGIALEIMLGTEVQLDFDLRCDSSDSDTGLPDYPLENIVCSNYYCAFDLNCLYSDAPLLLQCENVTLTRDPDGHPVFAVPIPNTAVEKLCQALDGKSSCPVFCEIGGFNTDGTAVFAWQFEITVRNRVYGGGGTPSTALTPDYYSAAQVEAVIGRELIFEFSPDGSSSWHTVCTADDKFLRLRHGANGTPSNAMPLPPMLNDTPWIPESETCSDAVVEMALSAHHCYHFDTPLTALTITSVETSLQETTLHFTASADGIETSFPAGLQWIGEPDFEAGKTYLISIVNNIAVAAEVTI